MPVRIIGIEGFLPGMDPNEMNEDGDHRYPHLRGNRIALIADRGLDAGQKVYIASARIKDGAAFQSRTLQSVMDNGMQFTVIHASANGTAALAELHKWSSDGFSSIEKKKVDTGEAVTYFPPEGSPPIDVTVVVLDPSDENNSGSGGASGVAIYP